METFYPYSRPCVTEEDIDAVRQVLEGQFLTQGPEVDRFEQALADMLGVRHVVTCANGTAALHLIYVAIGLGPKAGLLTTPVTFLATGNAARMLEAPVLFADVDPATGNLDPDAVRRALSTAATPIGAVAAVHLGGRPAEMDKLRAVTDAFGCRLVEDAAHALGAAYRDAAGTRHAIGACAHSDAAAFSFHAIKQLSMGEGGAVCTNDDALADHIRLLRNHGMSRDPETWRFAPEPDAPWYYEAAELGWNYRLADLQCALGRSQLARLERNNEARRRIAAFYLDALAGMDHVTLPALPQEPDGHAWHLYPLAIDFDRIGRTRGEVMRGLQWRGVGTQVHYIPLYHQPYYRDGETQTKPGAERYYARTLSIPMYPQLAESDLERIANSIRAELAA